MQAPAACQAYLICAALAASWFGPAAADPQSGAGCVASGGSEHQPPGWGLLMLLLNRRHLQQH